MSVNVPTKDVGDVKDVYQRESGVKKTPEDRNEDYIKREFGIKW